VEDSPEASAAALAGSSEAASAGFSAALDDDWERIRARYQSKLPEITKADTNAHPPDDGLSEDEDLDAALRSQGDAPLISRSCWMYIIGIAVALLAGAVYQVYLYLNPSPLTISVELVRPQKFKIDVTDFFAPRVSAAVQLVLQVRNANFFRALVLENCKLATWEAETSLKLASTMHERPMVISPLSTASLTLNVPSLGGSLPASEQRRLAGVFLSQKALFLTFVATATSRMNAKGSKSSAVSTNSTKRVDLTPLAKEPFFQRAPPPPPPPEEDVVHDVPL